MVEHRAPPPHWPAWQRVLNDSWPSRPRDVVLRDPIPVRVRVVWARDGETVVDGRAVGWIGRHVRVELDDPRLGPLATWVDASDVHRNGDLAG